MSDLRDLRRVKSGARFPRPSDYYREVEHLLEFANDAEANYMGLSVIDILASAICKRERRLFDLRRVFNLPLLRSYRPALSTISESAE